MEEEIKESKFIKDLEIETVVSKSGRKYRYSLYECCYCGREFKAQKGRLKKNKRFRGCGECNKKLTVEFKSTHSQCGTRLYRAWGNMINRCVNPNSINYHRYGGRGIKVCADWSCSFEEFSDWAFSNGYADDLTIDRIDNDGNYEPTNCRWVTAEVNSRNTTVLYSHNSSGYRGVTWDKLNKKWQAKACVKKNTINIGGYDTAKEAALARDKFIIANNYEHTLNFDKEYVLENAPELRKITDRFATNTSGYTGVNQMINGRWAAKIQIGSKQRYVGYSDTAKEAALMRDTFIIVYGLPNRRNFP